jgi:hypothetical protein
VATALFRKWGYVARWCLKKWFISRERGDLPPRTCTRIEKCKKNYGSVTPNYRNFGAQRSNFHIDFLVTRSRYSIDIHTNDRTQMTSM